MAAKGLEQLEHASVVATGLASQRKAHHVGQMVVANRHGIGVTESDDGDLGGDPRSHSREGLETLSGFGRIQIEILLRPRGPARDADDDRRPSPFDATVVVRPPGVGGTSRPCAPGATSPRVRTKRA